MFGKAFAVVMLLSSVACAKPRWAPAENLKPEEASQSSECALKFQSGLCLEWAWEKQPADGEFGTLVFKTSQLVDGSAQLMDLSGTPAVILWMPDMGHGSSPTTVTRIDVGTYRVTRVYFVMPGAWDIHFQNKSADKVIDEAIVSVVLE